MNYSQTSHKSNKTEKPHQKPPQRDLRNIINKTIGNSSHTAIDRLIEFITQAIINVIPSNSITEYEGGLKGRERSNNLLNVIPAVHDNYGSRETQAVIG